VEIIDGKPYKECAKCGVVKLITHFTPALRYKDGYRSYCRKCERDMARSTNLKYDFNRARRYRNDTY